MKNKKIQSVVLCSLALLLILGLSVGIIGLSLSGARIVPLEAPSLREQSAAPLDVTYSGYGSRAELDPKKLYERACSETIYLYYFLGSDSENMISSSGIIISYDGYILTNAHCVSDAMEAGMPVQIELYDGRTFTGEIVGADSETDVALVKIEAYGLSAATLGTSSLYGCQKVYAIGHPAEELKYTMTSGIISGLDRTLEFSDGTVLKMFQFDAAVNPGNSGGPVYDSHGCVVGMVTAKMMSLTTEGIGFAIPIQDAVAIAVDLKEHGYVTGRPLLGITAMSVAEGILRGGTSPAGVMVYSAEEGLPGAKAGLIKGDIIVGIDDRTVASMEDLTEIKKSYKAGDTVKIRFWRDGEYLETYLTFAEVTPEHPVGPVNIEEEQEEPGEEPSEGAEEEPAEEAEAPEEAETEDPNTEG